MRNTRTIAIVPIKLKTVDWEQTCKISRDYALKGIETISHLPREGKKTPLKFIYMSGYGSVRDQSSKKPLFYGDYSLMRVCIPLFFPPILFCLHPNIC